MRENEIGCQSNFFKIASLDNAAKRQYSQLADIKDVPLARLDNP